MGLMLLALSVVYWTLDKHSDAIILLIAYIPVVSIDVLLELRSQKALRALKRSVRSTCHVIRDGIVVVIQTRELVPGDLLVLEEGQTIPADGHLIEASNLTIDESSVTGESVPVEKNVSKEALSGTTILTGSGLVEIEKTGFSSQIGSIAKVLKEFEATQSPLLLSVRKAVKIVFVIALLLAGMIFAIGVYKTQGYSASLIAALTLAMAAIPEEFPLVFTLYLSLAAYRLSKKGILVKTLPAVEGLGRVDVICTDKTGTITEGRFKLERILGPKGDIDPSEKQISTLIFSCEPKATDAMESAMFEWVNIKAGDAKIEEIHTDWELQFDNQFDTREKYMSHVWKNKATGEQVITMKGALEGVLAHCEDSTNKSAIMLLAEGQAESGKRLLGLAEKTGRFDGNRESDEQSLKFVGILSFTDPVRPSVKPAIQACAARGIRIKMLTGDHLLTAHAVADKIGLPHEHDQLFTGSDLELLSNENRRKAYARGAIFARLKPEQKLQLVEALKSEGNIVAMTGDGINDAPALKLADVGISMGDRATDVARSTAQLVLLKNDFSGIVNSVLEGERVLNSLSQSFGYLIAFHIPIIGVVLFQSFFLSFPVLQPIHIILLELIVHPVSAFVFDTDNSRLAVRRKTLITRSQIGWSSARGLLLTAFALLIAVLGPGPSQENASLGAIALVVGNIGLLLAEKGGIISALSDGLSKRTLVAVGVLLALSVALAFVPAMSHIFSIYHMDGKSFGVVILVGILLGFAARPQADTSTRREDSLLTRQNVAAPKQISRFANGWQNRGR
jgi:Ca2+-transporting ATPase